MAVDWNSYGSHAAGPDEELPGQGRPGLLPSWVEKAPPATWWAFAFVSLVVAVALAAAGGVGSRPLATALISPARSTSSAPAAGDTHLALVRYLARHPGPLPIYIRSVGAPGGCPLVEPGTSPQRRITAAVRRVLPRFRLADVGYTLDPSSALCVLQLRARDGADSVLVVDIVRRRGDAAARVVDRGVSDGFTGTVYAFAVTYGGWAVTIGSIGPAGRQPSTKDLRELAQDPDMRW